MQTLFKDVLFLLSIQFKPVLLDHTIILLIFKLVYDR